MSDSNYGFEPTLDGLNTINSDSSTATDIVCDTITVNTSSSVPTRTAGDSTTNIANTAFVTNAISTAGTNYVTLTGTQTISGEKTFNNFNYFINDGLLAPSSGTLLFEDSLGNGALMYYNNDNTAGLGGLRVVSTSYGFAFSSTYGSGEKCSFKSENISFESVGGTTTFLGALPSCSIAPTSGNDLCNKTYVDSGAFVNLSGTQTITGAKTFSTNTLTASAGITIKNGASAQTATLTQNATTLDVIGAGDISIKPANDFNVVTGTGKNITVSTPSTSVLPSTQTYTTGSSNTGSSISLVSPTTYIIGISTQPSLVLSGGYGTIYGWQFTRGGTNTAAINRINSQNTLDTCYLEVNEGQNITLTDGVTSITGNFLLNQTNTTTSMGTTQIGYTVENTTRSTNASNTQVSNGVTKNILSFTPLKGVWATSFSWQITANTSGGAGSVDSINVCLSATTASMAEYRSFEFFREMNDAIGGSGGVRDIGNLSGVINADGSTAYYINANIGFSGLAGAGTVYLAIPMLTYTRIG